MYTGYELTEDSRKKLEILYPPKYRNFLGHHITEKFGVDANEPPPENPDKVEVIGYINNDKNVEGFLVAIDGKTNRPDGSRYHITWSIDRSKGAKPYHTNLYVDDALRLNSPVEIEVTPKTFTKSTDAYVKES